MKHITLTLTLLACLGFSSLQAQTGSNDTAQTPFETLSPQVTNKVLKAAVPYLDMNLGQAYNALVQGDLVLIPHDHDGKSGVDVVYQGTAIVCILIGDL